MEEGDRGRDHDGRGFARYARRVSTRCIAVVPAWRAEATLSRTLRSLLVENAGAVERVIVVGSSTDRCLDVARRWRDVEVVALPGRASAGRARNAGRQKAGACDLLLFVDADCTVGRGAVERLIGHLLARDLGAVGAAIAQDGDGSIAWVRHLLEFKEARPGVPGVSPRFLPSTVLLTRAGLFDACGGFPDMWPGEDLVLTRRMIEAGAHIEKVDAAVALHTHPEGLWNYLTHERRLGESAARARLMAGGEGLAFVGRVWLAPLLLCARAARALLWLARFQPAELPRFVSVLPLYLLGLAVWTLAFTKVPRAGALS